MTRDVELEIEDAKLSSADGYRSGTPNGIRTRVTGMRTLRPRPLDDGGVGISDCGLPALDLLEGIPYTRKLLAVNEGVGATTNDQIPNGE